MVIGLGSLPRFLATRDMKNPGRKPQKVKSPSSALLHVEDVR
jgi:hypothetical protein